MIFCPNCRNHIIINLTKYFRIIGKIFLKNKNEIGIREVEIYADENTIRLERFKCEHCENEFELGELIVRCFTCRRDTEISKINFYKNPYFNESDYNEWLCEDCNHEKLNNKINEYVNLKLVE